MGILEQALAPSTQQSYRRAWSIFCTFLAEVMLQPEVILPQDPTTVSIFAVHLSRQGFKVSTILSYLSALGYVHRLVGAIDPVKSQVVQKLLSAFQKRGQTLDVRCPMTLPIIKCLLVANKRTLWAAFEKAAMEAIMLVAFFGLFRLGELLLKLPNSSERVICLSDLKWEGNSVTMMDTVSQLSLWSPNIRVGLVPLGPCAFLWGIGVLSRVPCSLSLQVKGSPGLSSPQS